MTKVGELGQTLIGDSKSSVTGALNTNISQILQRLDNFSDQVIRFIEK